MVKFSYKTFAKNGSISKEGKLYAVVKKAFLEKFGIQYQQKELIAQASEARLDASSFRDSMKTLLETYSKAGMDEIARYWLLWKSVSGHSDLAQFALCQSAIAYAELK